MLKRFKRPVESNNYDNDLSEYLKQLRLYLDEISDGKMPEENETELIKSLIEEQDENGFWGLIPSPRVDSDIRVQYWYTPTYICTSIMINFYLYRKSDDAIIKGFDDTLKKALFACTGRKLKGHGYDLIEGLLDAFDILLKGSVMKFISIYPELSRDFTEVINEAAKWIKNSLISGKTNGDWNEDYTLKMKNIDELIEKDKEMKVFVYGTLMMGKGNHHLLKNAVFIDATVVKGYVLYDLGSFPGIIKNKDEKVKGELYKIDSSILKKLDHLEGEGSLYIRNISRAETNNGKTYDSFIYVYNRPVIEDMKISYGNQPWGTPKTSEDYVWYASYGSNMLYDRFKTYIEGGFCKYNLKDYPGCDDKTLPKDNRRILIPYKMYYGNTNSSWGDGGVSFNNF
jgi:gamma-glutamylcyclotransferase (GGCT)/AIG2-like uncharacterized protein YtfP